MYTALAILALLLASNLRVRAEVPTERHFLRGQQGASRTAYAGTAHRAGVHPSAGKHRHPSSTAGDNIDVRAYDLSTDPDSWMRLVMDDSGSEAYASVTLYRPKYNYWFGHTAVAPGEPVSGMLLLPKQAATSQLVAPPVGWERYWGTRKCDVGQRGGVTFGLWCPIAPQGYVALGCVMRRSECGLNEADLEPPSGDEVSGLVTLRADMAVPGVAVHVWNDTGSGAQANGSMWRVVGRMGNGRKTYSPNVMVVSSSYSPPEASRLWVIDASKLPVQHLDGAKWHGSVYDSAKTAHNQQENEALLKYAPTVRFHPGEEAWPVTIEYLLHGAGLVHTNGSMLQSMPLAPQDLALFAAQHDTSQYHLRVDKSIWQGMQPINNDVPAPIYASLVRHAEYVELTYFFIYAWQPGQAVRGDRVGTEFNCVLTTYGEHQGDVEQVAVRLKPDLSDIWEGDEAVGFARHEEISWWPRNQVLYDRGTHPIVYAALNGHASYNAAAARGSGPTDLLFGGVEPVTEWYYDLGGAHGFVIVLDLVSGKGDAQHVNPIWAPWQYTGGVVRIGINEDGRPYNDQSWVLYKGRFGIYQKNELVSAHHIGGGDLNTLDWAYVRVVDLGAHILGKLKDEIVHGNGPWAFGDCSLAEPRRRNVCMLPGAARISSQ